MFSYAQKSFSIEKPNCLIRLSNCLKQFHLSEYHLPVKTEVSSPKSLQFEDSPFDKSIIKIRNNKGPMIER